MITKIAKMNVILTSLCIQIHNAQSQVYTYMSYCLTSFKMLIMLFIHSKHLHVFILIPAWLRMNNI